MSLRKTGAFHPPQEVLVLTCDVCERDIGYEDGGRPRLHFTVERHPNAGALGDQHPVAALCSRECLQAYAENQTGPLREDTGAQQPAGGRRAPRPKS
jgi:hypothetical protein